MTATTQIAALAVAFASLLEEQRQKPYSLTKGETDYSLRQVLSPRPSNAKKSGNKQRTKAIAKARKKAKQKARRLTP